MKNFKLWFEIYVKALLLCTMSPLKEFVYLVLLSMLALWIAQLIPGAYLNSYRNVTSGEYEILKYWFQFIVGSLSTLVV